MLEWLLTLLPPMTPDQAASAQGSAAIVQAGLALLLTCITGWALWVSWIATATARRQRYDTLMPLLDPKLVHIALAPPSTARFDLRVTNIGAGPAINIRACAIVAKGTSLRYSLEGRFGPTTHSKVAGIGAEQVFEFLEERLVPIERAEFADARLSGRSDYAKVVQQDARAIATLKRRQESTAIRTVIAAQSPDIVIQIGYQDVYRRDFEVEIPVLPMYEDAVEQRLEGLIRLGEPTHTLPTG
jgi:hypothetical protein